MGQRRNKRKDTRKIQEAQSPVESARRSPRGDSLGIPVLEEDEGHVQEDEEEDAKNGLV